jgi:hypothetical protein
MNKKIFDSLSERYLEKVRKEQREKQVMLDLWNIATNGKTVVLKLK